MEEIWKDIEGYEGRYQISNLGNVKSLNYGGHGYAKDLVPKVNNCGRLWVELFCNGSKRQCLIHRLVGEAFIPNPNDYPQINHKDENPKNNVVENLEWCTQAYNNRYSLKLHPERMRQRHPKIVRTFSGKKIVQLSLNGDVLRTWEDIRSIVRETGMSQWSITQCCDGNRRKAYGFKWQYAI